MFKPYSIVRSPFHRNRITLPSKRYLPPNVTLNRSLSPDRSIVDYQRDVQPDQNWSSGTWNNFKLNRISEPIKYFQIKTGTRKLWTVPETGTKLVRSSQSQFWIWFTCTIHNCKKPWPKIGPQSHFLFFIQLNPRLWLYEKWSWFLCPSIHI